MADTTPTVITLERQMEITQKIAHHSRQAQREYWEMLLATGQYRLETPAEAAARHRMLEGLERAGLSHYADELLQGSPSANCLDALERAGLSHYVRSA